MQFPNKEMVQFHVSMLFREECNNIMEFRQLNAAENHKMFFIFQ